MKKVIILNGYPQSGKDTFVEMCSRYTSVNNIHTSMPAKRALRWLGWDGVDKSPEVRKLLSDFTQLAYKFNGVEQHVLDSLTIEADITFLHVREPNNIDYFKKLLGKHNTLTVLVMRESSVLPAYSNDSDNDVEDYEYELFIDNNGTLEDLEENAIAFIKFTKSWRQND